MGGYREIVDRGIMYWCVINLVVSLVYSIGAMVVLVYSIDPRVGME